MSLQSSSARRTQPKLQEVFGCSFCCLGATSSWLTLQGALGVLELSLTHAGKIKSYLCIDWLSLKI